MATFVFTSYILISTMTQRRRRIDGLPKLRRNELIIVAQNKVLFLDTLHVHSVLYRISNLDINSVFQWHSKRPKNG